MSSTPDAEIIVVGGGVAGAATALALARLGHESLVLDRARFPREKPCGEGLMPHGVAALADLGVLDRVLSSGCRPFTGIAYHVDRASAVGRFPGGRVGYGLRRVALDAELLAACRDSGRIDVREATRVRSVGGTGGEMRVDTGDRVLRCRAVVAADGLHSPIRRQLGAQAEESGRPRYGVRGHFRLRPGWRDRDVVDVFAADAGEFYLTPTGAGEVNLALLLERGATRQLAGDLEGGFKSLCLSFPPIAQLLEGSESISEPKLVGPLRQRATRSVHDGLLLVGDSAGFVDAITGEGMSIGLLSARIAAEELSRGLRANRLAAADLAGYERRRRREARDLVALTEIILWGIRHRSLARRVVRNLGRHPDLFGRVLDVDTGARSLASIGVRGLIRLLAG
jgi:2-polyprenyl-6-methoxyphenol hydroxylase-like FAD-dependent oxidoreductase